jgi:alpha-glucosidase (family GH31 glycosyl hydrolase)
MNFNFHTGLPSCLTAILSSGLIGYSNTHCDIGGYTQIEN